MNVINNAIKTLHYADEMAGRQNWLTRTHPLMKLLFSFVYLLMVVSVPKYDLETLLKLCVFPTLIMVYADISILKTIKQLWLVLIVLSLPGIANVIYDKTEIDRVGDIVITGGMISMLTLFVKGLLSVLTSFILLSSTSIEKICYALRMLYFPRKLVVVILLIHRYMMLLLKETNRIMLAYELRGGGNKGIIYHAWGTLAGLLFLRSADRAQLLYESMTLRGFDGDFKLSANKFTWKDLVILIGSSALIIMLRLPLSLLQKW